MQGDVLVKLPGSSEWTSLRVGDKVVPGSTIFTGMDANALLMIENKGVVQLLQFTEITVSEQGLEQAGKEGKTSTDIYLKTGEIEINVEPLNITPGGSGQQGWGMSVYGPYYAAAVRGTHFWVKQDNNVGSGVVGVYKGTVNVKNDSGSGQEISPQGDKPEVVLAAKKVSVAKLVLYALGVAAVIVAVVILKRRFSSKKSSKRKS